LQLFVGEVFMKTRNRIIAAISCLLAVFMLTASFTPEVTVKTTVKMNKISYLELSAGIQTVLNIAEEKECHEEIEEVLYEGVVMNEIPGYDWNTMVMADVEDTVNMRDAASEEGSIVGKLPKGAYGTVLEEAEGWTKISSGSVEGWVSNDYLLFDADAEELAAELGSDQATITTDALRIRKDASEEAGVYGLAEKGTTYKVVEEKDGWLGIQLDGKVGYISAEYAEVGFKLETAKTIEEIRAAEEKARKEAEAKKRAEAEAKAANASDVALLAAIVQMEAGNQSFEGKLAVASVVMNRVRSAAYPNTVKGVIYAPGQFPPAHTSRMASLVANGASAECVKAAKQALGGVDNVGGLTHFHAARLGGKKIIGGHAFY